MDIYLDFDGTVVVHKYPKIGEFIKDCLPVIKKLQEKGHKIHLNTLRCEFQDGSLEEAVEFLKKQGIIVDYVTTNKIHPRSWDFDLFKTNNYVMIDDICQDIPLTESSDGFPIVNWKEVEKDLILNKIL